MPDDVKEGTGRSTKTASKRILIRLPFKRSAQTARKKTAESNTLISCKGLQSLMHNIKYNNSIDRGRLLDALERTVVPWLPVGSDSNGEIYPIVPAAYRLQATR